MIKITTLIENELGKDLSLQKEHGLSLFIEADNKKILFDTGQSGLFINNAKSLEIDLNNLDYVILSHGHYDHSGGFKRLVEDFPISYQLLIGSGFFNDKYKLLKNGDYSFNGNSFGEIFLKENDIKTQVIHKDITYLTKNIIIFTNFIQNEKYENINQTMFIKEGHQYELDLFTDEIVIGLNTPNGLVLLVGCAHVGIINILETIKQRTGLYIYALLGGTHLLNANDHMTHQFIQYLTNNHIEIIGVSHCTGEKVEKLIQKKLTDHFYRNHTGDSLII